jgi:hypothetical protein
MNVLSTVLFLLALASLPITFFSLEAARDGNKIVSVRVDPYQIQWAEFLVTFTPALLRPDGTIIQGPALKPLGEKKWEYYFGFFGDTNIKDETVGPHALAVNIDPSIPVIFHLKFGERTIATSYEKVIGHLISDLGGLCDKEHPFVTSKSPGMFSYIVLTPFPSGDENTLIISSLSFSLSLSLAHSPTLTHTHIQHSHSSLSLHPLLYLFSLSEFQFFSLCESATLLSHESFRIAIGTNLTGLNPTKSQRYFNYGTISSDILFSYPYALVTTTQPCRGTSCFQLINESKIPSLYPSSTSL